MNTMRRLIQIVEDVDTDVAMHAKAVKLALAIQRALYDGLDADFVVEIAGVDLLGYRPETIGLTKVAPKTLFLLGERLPNTIGISGAMMHFAHRPLEGYDTAIVVRCLREDAMNDQNALKRDVGSVEFIDVLSHEIVHYLDFVRTQGRIFKKSFSSSDKKKYYNDPAEFNAYFHNLATNLLSFIHDARESPEDAHDLAEFSGIKVDFRETLVGILQARGATRGFLKWLSDDRQKAMLRRLYKIHQEAVKILLTPTAPDNQADT